MQDVDLFPYQNRFVEIIIIIIALHHLLTNGSSAVNGCRQNENPNTW